jgi:LacI family transcriptional regulator
MREQRETKGRVTLKDVARLAGVHASTVSRALNAETSALIGDDVVERVRAAARNLGYRPNTIASSLRTRRTKTIGVLLPDVLNAIFPPMIKAVEEVLRRENYLVLIAHADYGDPRQRVIVDQMMARQVDGLILATSSRYDKIIEACLENSIPLVTLTRAEPDLQVPSVINDETASMTMVVQHLAQLGHREIGHLAGPQMTSTGEARRVAFEAAMSRAGLAATAVVPTDVFTREAGAAGAARLLDTAPRTTAIVAGNDLLAIGALDTLKARGLRCPQDVSITGHNDMPLVDMIEPPLTTVRIDFAEMGAAGGRLLLQQMADPSSPVFTMTLKPQLIVRGSTAPPRADALE